jgi:hypothetical protein
MTTMNALTISDLSFSTDLDHEALAAVTGGDTWIQTGQATSYSSWSGYKFWFANQQSGLYNVNGVWNKKYKEGWYKTRTQYDITYWDHYVPA